MPTPLTVQSWLAEGRVHADERSVASWRFADWLAAGERAFGREALASAAELTGCSPEKISNYLTVSKTYPDFCQRKRLTFSHHLEVARLPKDVADRLLDAAEAGGWSCARLREAAREASLTGRARAQAAEIRALRREIAGLQANPRDVTMQLKTRAAAQRTVVVDAVKSLAAAVDDAVRSDILSHAHGNSRRGLARGLRRELDKMSIAVNSEIDRIDAALTVLESGPDADLAQAA